MAFLMQHEMRISEGAFNSWTVNVPAGVSVEKMQEPIYWTHVAERLGQWDEIRAQYLHSDGMWLAKFIVTAVDPEKKTWAKVKLVEHYPLVKGQTAITPEEPAKDDDFEVKHRGPQGWSVIRKQDSAVVFEKGKHPDDANRWIRDYRKKTAA